METLITETIITSSITAVLGIILGYFANKYKEQKSRQTNIDEVLESFSVLMKEHKVVMEVCLNLTRSFIISTCLECIDKNEIHETEFKNLCDMEELYHEQGGNSYTDELIEKTKAIYAQHR